MNGDPPQDKHSSEPPEAEQASEMRGSDSIDSVDPSVAQGRESPLRDDAGRDAMSRLLDQHLERSSDPSQTHATTSRESSGEAAAKGSVQPIRFFPPEGGNPPEHSAPEQLFDANRSQRFVRELAIQSRSTLPLREPVRYDTVLFAPKNPPASPSDSTLGDNTMPAGQSPFHTSGSEASDVQSFGDLETHELPSETDSSAKPEIVPEGGDPALPSSEASGQRVPEAKPQYQGIVRLSDPNPAPSAAAAVGGNSGGSAPPRTPDSASTQPPPAAEKAAPLPRVIVMVGLDDAERIVHEEMRVFSRELAIVGRQIAQEETENLMFDFRAQMNALFG